MLSVRLAFLMFPTFTPPVTPQVHVADAILISMEPEPNAWWERRRWFPDSWGCFRVIGAGWIAVCFSAFLTATVIGGEGLAEFAFIYFFLLPASPVILIWGIGYAVTTWRKKRTEKKADRD